MGITFPQMHFSRNFIEIQALFKEKSNSSTNHQELKILTHSKFRIYPVFNIIPLLLLLHLLGSETITFFIFNANICWE